MKTSHQTWLQGEAESWVEKEIITQEQADRILAEYPTKPILPQAFNWTFNALGGALLVVGLLLMLAYNWDALPRGIRLTGLIAVLGLTQAATFVTMHIDRLSRFREAAALVQSVAVGISLMLAAQTYDLGTDPAWLFGAWMVLILPIALLTETVLPVFAYAVLFFVWLLQAHDVWYIWLSWPLLFALVPIQRKFELYDIRGSRILAWLMVFGFSAAFLACFYSWFGDYAVQIMAIFFFCLSAMGVRLDRTDEFWNKPLFSLGLSGALLCMYLLTFYNLWHRSTEVIFTPSFFLLLGVVAIGGFFVWQHGSAAKRDGLLRFSAMMVPIVGVTTLLWIVGMPDWLAVGVINIYLFIIGFCLLVRGLKYKQISVFNIGMLLTAALIIARFFDIEADLMVRGGLYGILGIIFLAGNYRIMRQKGGADTDEDTVLQQVAGETADETDAGSAGDSGYADEGYTVDNSEKVDFAELVRTIREAQESLQDEDIRPFGKHTDADRTEPTNDAVERYARSSADIAADIESSELNGQASSETAREQAPQK